MKATKMTGQKQHPDAELIRQLGGPVALANRLGYKVSRVLQWPRRGISKAALVAHPWLLKAKVKADKARQEGGTA